MINYQELFTKFRTQIASDIDTKTPDITNKIKEFFQGEFSKYFIAPGDGAAEFLVDVFVSTRNPRACSEEELKVILAVGSELGGAGGGSQGYLQKNVLEDFAKLLVIQSEYKILIFTSLPYANESNHLENRVCEIDQAYRSAGSPGNILLIHLQAEAQKTERGNPTNPKVSLKHGGISAWLLSKGMPVQHLA